MADDSPADRIVTVLEDRYLTMELPAAEIRALFGGTSLVSCAGCKRAAVVRGDIDMEVMLTLIDDHDWTFDRGSFFCPRETR